MKTIFSTFIVIIFISILFSCDKDKNIISSNEIVPIELISPADSSRYVYPTLYLRWKCDYTDSFNVYFDTHNPPSKLIAQNIKKDSLLLTGLMDTTKYYWKVTANIGEDKPIESPIWNFTTSYSDSTLPVPHSPIPAINSITHKYSDLLRWQCDYAERYGVYFDVINPPENLIVTSTIHKVAQLIGLRQNSTYYWKIVAKFPDGRQTHGDIWQFHVGTFEPPYIPYSEVPRNNTTSHPTSLTLSWRCDVEDEFARPLRFDVFFGAVDPPTNMIYSSISARSVPISGLELNQKYYWKLKTYYPNGEIHEGAVWNFTTTSYVSDMYLRMPDVIFNLERWYRIVTPTWSRTEIDTIDREIKCNINPITKTFNYQNDTLFYNYYADPEMINGWIFINQSLNTLDFEYDYSMVYSYSEPGYAINRKTDLKLIFLNLPYSDIGTQMIEANIDYNSLLNHLSGFHYSYWELIFNGNESYETRHTGLSVVNFTNANLKLVLNKNLLQ